MLDIFFLFGIFVLGFYFMEVMGMLFKHKVPLAANLLFGIGVVCVAAKFVYA